MNFSTKSILVAIMVIGSIALGYFLVWPKWGEYSLARTQLEAATAQQEQLKLAQAQLNTFLNEYKQHSVEAARLNQALPLSSSEIYNILNNLDVLTRTSGLTLGVLSFEETGETDSLGAAAHSIRPIALAISGSGSYLAFRNFLTSLESNLRLMDIESVTFGAEGDSMSFNLDFKTYYQN